MRFFLFLGLALFTGQSSAFLFSGNGLISTVLDTGVSLVHNVADTAVQLGGKVVDVILDPFEIWKPDTDTDHGHSQGKVTKCPAVADVIFVMDASSSIGSSDFYKQLDFAVRLTEHFKIGGRNVRFGAVVYSDSAKKVFDLEDYKNHKDIRNALKATPYLSGGTKTYHGLDMVRLGGMFKKEAGARSNSEKIIIVMTDGNSDRVFKTIDSAKELRAQGVNIIAVGIGAGMGIELNGMADGSYNVFHADDYASLINIEQTVARRTCEIPQASGKVPSERQTVDRCKNNPCEHICTSFNSGYACSCRSGFIPSPEDSTRCQDIDECNDFGYSPCAQRCHNSVGGFSCSCNSGYTISESDPSQCLELEIRMCRAKADIIFLVDSSGSIGDANYAKQLQFVAKITQRFDVGHGDVRFGAVLFSSKAKKLFDLKTHTDSESLAEAIVAAPYLKGTTYTNKALNLVSSARMFSTNKGGRSQAEKIVIVLTDGKSSKPDLTQSAAEALRDKGVRILTVGIGANVSAEELADMASTLDDMFRSDNFELLENIESVVAERACGN